jgi:hypothetical protein
MNMPRFTAEISLYQTNGHYRTNGGGTVKMAAAALTPALQAGGEPDTWVDCNEWSSWAKCAECGCRPGYGECRNCCYNDNCVVIDRNPGLTRPPQPIFTRPQPIFTRSSAT